MHARKKADAPSDLSPARASEAHIPAPQSPLSQVKEALRDISFGSKSRHIVEQADKLPVSETLRIGASWLRALGGATLIERVTLRIAAQTIPVYISWYAAKLAPLAMSANANGDGSWSVIETLAIMSVLGLAQVAITARANVVDQRAANETFRYLHRSVLNAGIDLSPTLLEQPSIQNRITKVRENLWALSRHVDSFFNSGTAVAGLAITAAALVPVSPGFAGCLALIGVWRVYQAQRYGIERTLAESVLAEPRRQMWYSSWPLREPSGLLSLKNLLRAGRAADRNVAEMKQLDDADLYLTQRQSIRGAFNDLGVLCASTAATGYGLLAYIGGTIDLNSALFLGGAVALFAAKVKELSESVGIWVSTKGFVEEADALINASHTTRTREQELPPTRIRRYQEPPGIVLENVTISALRSPRDMTDAPAPMPIVKNISLDIKPGEFIGVVGRAGAGKTTLTKLILGAVEPSQGKVLVGGADIASIPIAELRANTGYLPQVFWNYTGRSVAENITIGNPIWDDDASIDSAVSDSGLAFVMSANKFGMNTVVGPEFSNGRNFSGGESQLIALARALAKRGKLLLLDEPAAHLDPDTAQSVVEHLRGLSGVTRVLVSHDMGLVRQCDRIVVLSKENDNDENSPGRIEAIGTHAELMRSSITYRRFFSGQALRFGDPEA